MPALLNASCTVSLQLEFQLGNREMVVRSNICSALHTHTHILERSKLPAYAYIVYLVLCWQVRWYPCCLVYPFVLEDTPSNKQVAQSTQVGKSFTTVIHLSQPKLSHDLIASVVAASLSTEVSHHEGNVSSWAVLNDSRQSAVKLFFYILTTVMYWGITLDDINDALLFLALEGGLENPWSVCLPVSTPCAVLDSIRVTPWVCGILSSWPDYSSNSPVASLSWPDTVHLVSLFQGQSACSSSFLQELVQAF